MPQERTAKQEAKAAFESLRAAEERSAGGSFASGHGNRAADFVVELPDAFERPYGGSRDRANATMPQQLPSRAVHPPAAPDRGSRKGISGWGAFFLAIFSQVVVAGILVGLAYLFPDDASWALKKAAAFLKMEAATPAASSAITAPANNPNAAPLNPMLLARIEILELEDRAIFRKERTAFNELQRLSQTLDSADPRYDAVQASLLRIRRLFETYRSEEPPPLKVSALFPGKTMESELSRDLIVTLLRDPRQAPETRQRAAYLLGQARTAPGVRALYESIQEDPNLGVVAEAFDSLRGATKYGGDDWSDLKALQSWWNAEGSLAHQ